jgi:hypothetical protein
MYLTVFCICVLSLFCLLLRPADFCPRGRIWTTSNAGLGRLQPGAQPAGSVFLLFSGLPLISSALHSVPQIFSIKICALVLAHQEIFKNFVFIRGAGKIIKACGFFIFFL